MWVQASIRSDMALCSECDRAADHLVQLKSHCDSRPQDSRPHFGYQIWATRFAWLPKKLWLLWLPIPVRHLLQIACRRSLAGSQAWSTRISGWNLLASNLLDVIGGTIIMWKR